MGLRSLVFDIYDMPSVHHIGMLWNVLLILSFLVPYMTYMQSVIFIPRDSFWPGSIFASGHFPPVHWLTRVTYASYPGYFPVMCRDKENTKHAVQEMGVCVSNALMHYDVIKWKHFLRYWPLCREFTGHRWISLTMASDAELWCFFDLRLNKRLSKHSWGWLFETINTLIKHREIVLYSTRFLSTDKINRHRLRDTPDPT